MPRNDRAPSFQFYPGDWLSDPAVDSLSFDQQGRYLRAMCMSWQTDNPGVATEDQWRRWMAYSPGKWSRNRDSHARCFEVSDDGTWLQKRMILTKNDQDRRHETAVAGALATNVKRWGITKGLSLPDTSGDRRNGRRTVSPSSATASSTESPPPPLAGGACDWFTKCQDGYPRKGGSPADSRTAFVAALARHPGKIDAEDLANAASSYAARCRADGIAPSRCPSLRRWLSRDEFLIEFEDKPPPARAALIDFGEHADPETVAEAMREIDRALE